LYEYSPEEDAASSSARSNKSPEEYYRENGYPEESSSTVPNYAYISREDSTTALPQAEEETPVPAVVDTETAEKYYRENGYNEEQTDAIESLHMVSSQSKVAAGVPVPAPRSSSDKTEVKVESSTATSSRVKVEIATSTTTQDELDYEDMIKKNVSMYKSERSKTNAQVLADIAAEEGEDRPDVKKLLAWAKSTKKSKTQTIIDRQKRHEDKIKKAVDFGGVNLVLAEKSKTTVAEPTVLPKKGAFASKTNKSETEDDVLVIRIAASLGLSKPTNIKINKLNQGVSLVTFSVVGTGDFKWTLVNNNETANKDVYVKRDLAKKIISFLGDSRKTEDMLPFNQPIYNDKKWTVYAENALYTSPNPNKPLDEAHLKVGMKSLARLHALTYLYFKSQEDPVAIKMLANSSYLETNRAETKQNLEKKLEKIVNAMQQGSSSTEIDSVKSLKNMLVNIYKEAESTHSILPVVCHGMPTLANIVFKYSADGQPQDAKFVSLDSCVLGSGLTDLHLFINTSGDNTAREDFLLRFVYYETLVTILKSFGVKVEFSYDDLKAEFVKKRLYGYIQSSAIFAESLVGSSKSASTAAASKMASSKSGPREVQSKILGKFTPRAKVMAVAALSGMAPAADKMDPALRIIQLIEIAVKI